MKGIRKGDGNRYKSSLVEAVHYFLFLFVCGFFFAFIDYVGPIISWMCTILFGILFLLSLLDQLLEWSRLKIDANGYDLRTWFNRQRFRHEEIDSFSSQTYLNRQLIILKIEETGFGNSLVTKILNCLFNAHLDNRLRKFSKHCKNHSIKHRGKRQVVETKPKHSARFKFETW